MTDQQQEDKIHKEELHEAILSWLSQGHEPQIDSLNSVTSQSDRRAQDGGSIALYMCWNSAKLYTIEREADAEHGHLLLAHLGTAAASCQSVFCSSLLWHLGFQHGTLHGGTFSYPAVATV